ncbi:MAG TPA: hypothetical protein VKH20_06330 [Solirubrobacterales bacterium]|nr:hypothetical protein [Solirubrobacterales bacterium]
MSKQAVLGTPLEPPFPEGIEVAYFALGCYWSGERLFWAIDAVHCALVGTGVSCPSPAPA